MKYLALTLCASAVLSACSSHLTDTNDNDAVSQPSTAPVPVQLPESEAAIALQTLPAQLNSQAIPQHRVEKAVSADTTYESLAIMPTPLNSLATSSTLPIMEPSHNNESRENYANTPISNIKLVSEYPVSTFATDVDTASYTNARRFLSQGILPPAESVRLEEFINYFDYQLPVPKTLAQPLNISTELMQTPWNNGTQLMRVSLQAYESSLAELPPLNLVFLLDVSGSMNSPDKLPLMQRSFNLLVNQLRPQDRVAIAVYAGQSGVVLEPTAGDDKTTIIRAINQLQAGGSTAGSAGIQLAYELAEQHFAKDAINRVIIGTDGDFNVGTTSIDELKKLIEQKRNSGVLLSVLGFGTGNYNDHLMEELSNHGNGVAYYIDTFSEARKVFEHQFTATLQTIAKDVKIQVEFNPQQIAEYRLLGYDNRELNREDFNNDKIDAGDMGSGHSVTALYEIVPVNSAFRFIDPLHFSSEKSTQVDNNSDDLAVVKVRYKPKASDVSELIKTTVTAKNNSQTDNPSDSMQLAVAVAGFAELLRNSPYTKDLSLTNVEPLLQASLANDRWGYRQELLQLLKNAQSIF